LTWLSATWAAFNAIWLRADTPFLSKTSIEQQDSGVANFYDVGNKHIATVAIDAFPFSGR
jgi:hypothetical protein